MENTLNMTRLDIQGEMTIFTAADLRDQLLATFDLGMEIHVDLSAVTELDSAGIQLLFAARCEAAKRNKHLTFTGSSPVMQETLALCNLAGQLNLAPPATTGPQ